MGKATMDQAKASMRDTLVKLGPLKVKILRQKLVAEQELAILKECFVDAIVAQLAILALEEVGDGLL
jgi:hypothetical protein